jgi:hypothetical protein
MMWLASAVGANVSGLCNEAHFGPRAVIEMRASAASAASDPLGREERGMK